jgi:hypothetical protein
VPAAASFEAEISFEFQLVPRAGLLMATNGALVPRDIPPAFQAVSAPRIVSPKPLAPRADLTVAVTEPAERPKSRQLWRKSLGPVVNIGRFLPRRTVWLAAVLPLAGILVFSTGIGSSRPQAGPTSGLTAGLNTQWQDLRASIAQRAAVSLHDDFRAGLGQWDGSGNWSGSWSFDRSGLVRPGRLALYKPSFGLSEYRFEFSVHVEQGGIGWVCRARDSRNYEAMKLLVGGTDSPNAALVRYRVVDGKAGRRTRTPLPLLGRQSMQFVRVDVLGSDITVSVDNHLVDNWRDPDPEAGGIGLFTEPGDRARVAWVSVSHQYDLIGRLCALIAPNNRSAQP